jgi:hypothetical protein
MKLSNDTMKILKNFATINQGLVVKPGNILRTISANKAILAEAEVEESFPFEFGIYDLNKSLSLISLSNEHEVEISKEFLEFKGLDGKGKIRQRFTPTNLILSPPDKKINIASYEVSLTLGVDIVNWIFSVANVLKCPNVVIKGEGGEIQVAATDVKGVIVDDANVSVNGECEDNFSVAIKLENLKIIPQEYDVNISSAGVCQFVDKSGKLTYWIATEQSYSNFGG